MKKYILFICIIASVIVFCILQINVYVFSPEICHVLMQKSPEEFCAEKGNGTLLGDNYIYSRVNKNGNLFLVLSNSQKENWKYLVLEDDVTNSFKKLGDIEISKDYTKCTLKCYKETALDNTASFITNVLHCVFIQAIEGKDSEDIKVECYFVDAITNEVKYYIVFPDEELNFSIDPNIFSSYKANEY